MHLGVVSRAKTSLISPIVAGVQNESGWVAWVEICGVLDTFCTIPDGIRLVGEWKGDSIGHVNAALLWELYFEVVPEHPEIAGVVTIQRFSIRGLATIPCLEYPFEDGGQLTTRANQWLATVFVDVHACLIAAHADGELHHADGVATAGTIVAAGASARGTAAAAESKAEEKAEGKG